MKHRFFCFTFIFCHQYLFLNRFVVWLYVVADDCNSSARLARLFKATSRSKILSIFCFITPTTSWTWPWSLHRPNKRIFQETKNKIQRSLRFNSIVTCRSLLIVTIQTKKFSNWLIQIHLRINTNIESFIIIVSNRWLEKKKIFKSFFLCPSMKLT